MLKKKIYLKKKKNVIQLNRNIIYFGLNPVKHFLCFALNLKLKISINSKKNEKYVKKKI